jgi:hypothetical protein
MTTFLAKATKDGGFDLGSEYNRLRLRTFLKENAGIRMKIQPVHIESEKQRNFFEGAVIPMITYFQEGADHRNSQDCYKIREWVKQEFNSEQVVVNGKVKTIGASTSDKLKELLEKTIDWMDEQGYPIELLNPEDYKYWKDVIYSNGGADNYIDFLVETKKL